MDDIPRTKPEDGKPALTLMYADGLGYYAHRVKNGVEVPRMDLTGVDTGVYCVVKNS